MGQNGISIKYFHPFDDDGYNKVCFVFTSFHDRFISFVELISSEVSQCGR